MRIREPSLLTTTSIRFAICLGCFPFVSLSNVSSAAHKTVAPATGSTHGTKYCKANATFAATGGLAHWQGVVGAGHAATLKRTATVCVDRFLRRQRLDHRSCDLERVATDWMSYVEDIVQYFGKNYIPGSTDHHSTGDVDLTGFGVREAKRSISLGSLLIRWGVFLPLN
jgi:hypothetical protein